MNRLLKELESLKGEKSSTESKAPSPANARPVEGNFANHLMKNRPGFHTRQLFSPCRAARVFRNNPGRVLYQRHHRGKQRCFRRSQFGLDSERPRRRYGSHGSARSGRASVDDSKMRMEPSRRLSSLVWMDWTLASVTRLLEADQLPNLARLKEQGGFSRVATTRPAQTPVAWSTFATGVNPGGHGIFDFLRRNPKNYLPELALNRYEQKNVFLPPKAVNLRRGVPVWDLLGRRARARRFSAVRAPIRLIRMRGQMLSGMGVPDLRGGLGTSTFYTSSETATARESEQVVRPSRLARRFHNSLDRSPQSQGGRRPSRRHHPQGRFRRPDASCPVRRHAQGTGSSARGSGATGCASSSRSGCSSRSAAWCGFFSKAMSPNLRFTPRRLISTLNRLCFRSAILPSTLPSSPRIGLYYTTGMVEDHAGLNNERISEQTYLDQCEIVWREREAMMIARAEGVR